MNKLYRAIFLSGKWYVTQVKWNARERDNLQTIVEEGDVVAYAQEIENLEAAIGDNYEMVEPEE